MSLYDNRQSISWVFAYFRNMYNSLYNSHVVNKDCIQAERHNTVNYEKLHVIELIHCLPYVRICAFEKIFMLSKGALKIKTSDFFITEFTYCPWLTDNFHFKRLCIDFFL